MDNGGQIEAHLGEFGGEGGVVGFACAGFETPFEEIGGCELAPFGYAVGILGGLVA